jgi:hypothetical protein
MNVGNQPTNEIVEFLKQSPSHMEGNSGLHNVENIIVSLKYLLVKSPPFDHRTSAKPIFEEIQKLQIFKNCQSPVWDTYAARIRMKAELLECVTDSFELCNTIINIIQMLEALGQLPTL